MRNRPASGTTVRDGDILPMAQAGKDAEAALVARQLENVEAGAVERVYMGQIDDEEQIALHVARYEFAMTQLTSGGVVLDAACGSGYGTEMLSQTAHRVVGLDLSDHALSYARAHHHNARVTYAKANFNERIDFPPKSFDSVVCLETLEHISDQARFVGELHRLLKPGGRLIISTPDRWVWSWLIGTRNRFHVHELTRSELIRILRKGFNVQGVHGQWPCRGPVFRNILRASIRRYVPVAVKRSVKALMRRDQMILAVNYQVDPRDYAVSTLSSPTDGEYYRYQIGVADRV